MWRNWLRPRLNRTSWRQRHLIQSLGAPVEWRNDRWGVCHIFAKKEEDLFRAQGYITARDRLFQMDMLRRTSGGRLAELYGDVPGIGFDPTLHLRGHGLSSVDYLMRTVGLHKASQEGLAWVSPRTHRVLLAYAEGINEFIQDARRKNSLPLAYKILDRETQEWHPTDSLLILRLLAFQLSFSWRLLLNFGALCYALPHQPKRLQSMLPPHLPLTLGLEEYPQGLQDLFRPHSSPAPAQGKENPHVTSHLFGGTNQGSCAWVIAGKHTRSGAPLLCNDPHLLLRLPAAFYQIRLWGGEYNVIGQSIPGCPGVFIGHNEQIAWGTSFSRLDDADIFIEELDNTSERYRHRDRLLPLLRREEIIDVRGETPKHRWVRSTSRGPLLSDALRGPLPPQLHYSLGWVGLEAVREVEAILQFNRANRWQQFVEAARYARVPSLNYIYADRAGNIGSIMAGKCPKRPKATRTFRPLSGADGLNDWQGEIPFDELPRVFNPPEGFLISAGQQPHQGEHPSPHGLWEPPFRYKRIKEMLIRQLEKRPDPKTMARLQRDHYSLWGREFIERILKPYAKESKLAPPIQKCLEHLLQWNGRVGPESLASSYFTMFQLKLMDQTYRPHMGEELYRRWIDVASEFEPPIEPLFRNQDIWFDQPRFDVLHTAFTQAYHELQKRLGTDPRQWQWSRLHRLTLRPLFFWAGGLQNNFTQGPFATGGNAFCINTGNHSWSRPFEHRTGAAARQIIDLSDWDHSTWILCGGQTENPQSPHYNDQFELWLTGDDIPMHYTLSTLHLMEQRWLLPKKQTPPASYLSQMTQIHTPSLQHHSVATHAKR